MKRDDLKAKMADLLIEYWEHNEDDMVEVELVFTDLTNPIAEVEIVFWEEEQGEWVSEDPALMDAAYDSERRVLALEKQQDEEDNGD